MHTNKITVGNKIYVTCLHNKTIIIMTELYIGTLCMYNSFKGMVEANIVNKQSKNCIRYRQSLSIA